MGLGIEHRARTLAPHWAEHLGKTRAAQARWVAAGDWLTVLGAGRLFDFNRQALLPRFRKLRLVDADPLCQAFWKGLPVPIEMLCLDISNCLADWINELRTAKLPWEETLSFIRQRRPRPAYGAPVDALLSLNVLSQLQIVWQDGVEGILRRRFGRRFVERHAADWLDATRPGGQMLVEQHLAAIESSEARFALIITDLEYLEYRGKTFAGSRWEPAPVEWAGRWRVDSGITCEVSPALEGIELNATTLALWMPSFLLEWHESWLWHIQPNGTEKMAAGKVHRVGAFALRRKGEL
jgi:hypothetical protein